MKAQSLLLISFVLVGVLVEVKQSLKIRKAQTKKPPDLITAKIDEKINENITDSEQKDEVKSSGEEDELIGQETTQDKVSHIEQISTEEPITSAVKYVRPLQFYPARYTFGLKPSTVKTSKILLRSTNTSSNETGPNKVSAAMRKWRSRYNYIFRNRDATRKPSYLKKYYDSYLLGSESSTYSKRTKKRGYSKFNGGSNQLKNYRQSRSRSRSGRTRSRTSRYRGRGSRRTGSRFSRRHSGLSTSGSYTSYSTRRVYHPAAKAKEAVPGIPKLDYPAYTHIPKTSFSCDNKVGSFPDYEAGCQLWHMCYGGGLHSSFLCPNGTLFNVKVSVCDWWYMVSCE